MSLNPAWANVSIIHFNNKTLSPSSPVIRDWAERTPFASLESCAHQVWAGHDRHMTTFPIEASTDYSLLSGVNAYRFALELLLSLKSPKLGENHIICQFREKWDAFQKEYPVLEESMRPFKQALERDNTLIRSAVLDHIIPARYTKAVQNSSGLVKGNSILIIGHVTRWDMPSDDMRDLILFLCNNRNGKPLVSSVTLLTPEGSQTEAVAKWYATQKDQKRVHPLIACDTISLGSALRGIDIFDRVYMTSTMGRHEDLEFSIGDAWAKRERRDNTLTCLRGDPQLRGQSSVFWKNMSGCRVVLPEDIWQALKSINAHNNELVAKARSMIEFCIETRQAGRVPSAAEFSHIQKQVEAAYISGTMAPA